MLLEHKGWSGDLARFPQNDFAAIARSMGIDACTLTSSQELEALLPTLSGLREPLLVDVVINQDETTDFVHRLKKISS